jgi:lysophospholipase L1-like esterase
MRTGIVLIMLFVAAVGSPAQIAAPSTVPQAQPASPSCPELAKALTALVNNDMRLRDWANLARYRELNRTLTAPAADEARVVFMGDSITDFWQRQAGGFFPGRHYVDRGISGQTTPQMLIRFHPDVVELKPKAVLILAGTNDIAGNTGSMSNEEIEGNLAAMSEIAQANGTRVILSSILPVSAYHNPAAPQTITRPMVRILALNEWMKSYATKHGHIYLDYFSAMIDSSGMLKEELSTDDLHPNAQGYAIMAPLAQAAIERALK